MKATGIIRRIDNLGRVVIPKEIRKNLRIKNGDNIEIFINENDNIVLKKYSQIDKLNSLATTIADAINVVTKKDVLITNTSDFIAASGSYKRKYLNKPISNELNNILANRNSIIENIPVTIDLIEEKPETLAYAIVPIIAEGDIYGLIMIISSKLISEEEEQITKVGASFLAKYIED